MAAQNPIELSCVSKSFRLPHEKRTTLYENVVGFLVGKKQSYEEFWALKDVTLSVRKGEALGLLGRNGSGKSTLLRIIGNIYPPTTGTVRATGRIMPFIELGVGFQHELSGRENVYLYGSIMGLTKRQVSAKYDEIVGFAELDEFMDLPLKDYSSGMVMRLAFSTAIMTDPDILLIDEVLAVGDVAFKKKSLERMNELWNSGKTIIFVSHQPDQVKELCENSVLLSHGRIASRGPSDEVVKAYNELLRAEESGNIPLHDGAREERRRARQEERRQAALPQSGEKA